MSVNGLKTLVWWEAMSVPAANPGDIFVINLEGLRSSTSSSCPTFKDSMEAPHDPSAYRANGPKPRGTLSSQREAFDWLYDNRSWCRRASRPS